MLPREWSLECSGSDGDRIEDHLPANVRQLQDNGLTSSQLLEHLVRLF